MFEIFLCLQFKQQLLIPVANFYETYKIIVTFFVIVVAVNAVSIYAVALKAVIRFNDIKNGRVRWIRLAFKSIGFDNGEVLQAHKFFRGLH